MSTLSDGIVSKIQDGANIYNTDNFIMPKYNLMSDYNKVLSELHYITDRSYEHPYRWFFLTFKPFNKTYSKYHDFYQKKGLDHCRLYIRKHVKSYIMTKEIDATKTHINALVVSDKDLLSLLHEDKTNKYFIFCEECIDRHNTLKYIIKESHTRYFYKFKDYVHLG